MQQFTPPPFKPLVEIEPKGGIISRMRAIASAMCLAEDLSRNLLIVWQSELNACLGEAKILFQLDALPSNVRCMDMPPMRRNLTNQCTVRTEAEWEAFKATQPAGVPYLICSDGAFYQAATPRWVAALQRLRFAPHLYQLATKVLHGNIAMPLIGVHLRTRGSTTIAKLSPTPAFIIAMKAYPATAKFLVASDSEQERAALAAAFPGRTFFAAESAEDPSTLGTMETIVDFLTLSLCMEILAPVNSSFAETAAAYGGRRLYRITYQGK